MVNGDVRTFHGDETSVAELSLNYRNMSAYYAAVLLTFDLSS